jgi:hypothetical protein
VPAKTEYEIRDPHSNALSHKCRDACASPSKATCNLLTGCKWDGGTTPAPTDKCTPQNAADKATAACTASGGTFVATGVGHVCTKRDPGEIPWAGRRKFVEYLDTKVKCDAAGGGHEWQPGIGDKVRTRVAHSATVACIAVVGCLTATWHRRPDARPRVCAPPHVPELRLRAQRCGREDSRRVVHGP